MGLSVVYVMIYEQRAGFECIMALFDRERMVVCRVVF